MSRGVQQLLDRVDVLVDRVGGALIPSSLGDPLLGRDDLDILIELAAEELPPLVDVPAQAHGLVLRQDEHPADVRVDAVGQGEVDDPVDPAERDGGLGAVAGQRLQARPPAPGQDDGQHVAHSNGPPPRPRSDGDARRGSGSSGRAGGVPHRSLRDRAGCGQGSLACRRGPPRGGVGVGLRHGLGGGVLGLRSSQPREQRPWRRNLCPWRRNLCPWRRNLCPWRRNLCPWHPYPSPPSSPFFSSCSFCLAARALAWASVRNLSEAELMQQRRPVGLPGRR